MFSFSFIDGILCNFSCCFVILDLFCNYLYYVHCMLYVILSPCICVIYVHVCCNIVSYIVVYASLYFGEHACGLCRLCNPCL